MKEEKIIHYMMNKHYQENKYVCWDFVMDVYKDEYNINLPEYPVDEVQAEFKKRLTSNIPHVKVEGEPIEGDIIVFSLFANQHAGVMIDYQGNHIILQRNEIINKPLKELEFLYLEELDDDL